MIGAVLILSMAAPAEAIIPPDTKCATGRVAITFDDGPSKVNTPKLLKILRAHHAQATFFVQGQFVRRYPNIVRATLKDGHAVEVHSWDHPELTERSSRSVKRQLNLTKLEIRRVTGQTPALYRPPYGDTSKRVRKIGKRLHLREELWTIDTRDWSGRSATKIRKAALKHLRPHKSNVILMHDAVNNSPKTLKAVPGIIKGLRKKGYCLVPMQYMMPWGVVTGSPVTVDEGVDPYTLVPVTLRLDGPSQRRASLHVRAVAGDAMEGSDFEALSRDLIVPRGARSVTFKVRIYPDLMPNTDKHLTIELSKPRALHFATSSIPVTITDNTEWHGEAVSAGLTAMHSLRLIQ